MRPDRATHASAQPDPPASSWSESDASLPPLDDGWRHASSRIAASPPPAEPPVLLAVRVWHLIGALAMVTLLAAVVGATVAAVSAGPSDLVRTEQTARLEIQGTPDGAAVEITRARPGGGEERWLGTLPATFDALPAGATLTLAVQAAGHASQRSTIEVPVPGERVTLHLTPAPRALRLHSLPTGQTVWRGETSLGETPLLVSLAPGDAPLSLGPDPQSALPVDVADLPQDVGAILVVVPERGKRKTASHALPPRPGPDSTQAPDAQVDTDHVDVETVSGSDIVGSWATVEILSDRAGVTVSVDGKAPLSLPQKALKLSPGDHRLVVVDPAGGQRLSFPVSVPAEGLSMRLDFGRAIIYANGRALPMTPPRG